MIQTYHSFEFLFIIVSSAFYLLLMLRQQQQIRDGIELVRNQPTEKLNIITDLYRLLLDG